MAHLYLLVWTFTAWKVAFAVEPENFTNFQVECLSPLAPFAIPGIFIPVPEPILGDCRRAAGVFHDDSQLNETMSFGDKSMPGVQRSVPIDWQVDTCLIHLETKDLANVATFRLADIYPVVEHIIKICVAERGEGLRQGGYAVFGDNDGFYIMVQASPGESYATITYNNGGRILPRLGVDSRGNLIGAASTGANGLCPTSAGSVAA